MPRKPSLSPSKIKTYLACPVKYRWTYVDGSGRFYMRAKSYYSFGTVLHNVLQRLHDPFDAEVQTAEQAVEALKSGWIEAGYESPQAAAEALVEGEKIIQKQAEAVMAGDKEVTTLLTEKMLRMEMKGWDLIGRIDRVDERPDGSIEVVDYKSGRLTVEAQDVASDLAMNCYQLMLRKMYPGRRVFGTILALRTGDTASYALPDEDVEPLTRDMQIIGDEILTTEFYELEPKVLDICPECDFLELCMKHPEFAEEYRSLLNDET
ncbi:MAG: PD-(D/E)XK nuclease family protein [Fimbriimonadaceae bacterium]|nr:PD-(D/E)XK nuclease family protein [Fimbriimonadaceae bacterium]